MPLPAAGRETSFLGNAEFPLLAVSRCLFCPRQGFRVAPGYKMWLGRRSLHVEQLEILGAKSHGASYALYCSFGCEIGLLEMVDETLLLSDNRCRLRNRAPIFI
jgi:hypothetical protein